MGQHIIFLFICSEISELLKKVAVDDEAHTKAFNKLKAKVK